MKLIRSKFEILKENPEGYLIDASEKVARAIIESLKGGKFSRGASQVPSSRAKIGIVGGDDAFNRRAVESLKIDYLVSPERGVKKDSLKQRDSGINHVVAKEMAKRGVVLVVDFAEISNLKGKEKALRLERVIQNIKICRKAGCGIRIASLGSCESEVVDKKGRKAFGLSLGMSSKQSVESVRF